MLPSKRDFEILSNNTVNRAKTKLQREQKQNVFSFLLVQFLLVFVSYFIYHLHYLYIHPCWQICFLLQAYTQCPTLLARLSPFLVLVMSVISFYFQFLNRANPASVIQVFRFEIIMNLSFTIITIHSRFRKFRFKAIGSHNKIGDKLFAQSLASC